MKDLNLNQLLRYGFSGAFFILTVVTTLSIPQTSLLFSSFNPYLLTAVAIVIGALIHALHRAIPEKVLDRIWFTRKFKQSLTLQDIARWKRLQNTNSLQSHLSEWASQIHFLWGTSWAILIPLVVGPHIYNTTGLYAWAWGLWAIVLTSAFAAGTFAAWRELEVAQREPLEP